jgi:hypothetical protein
LIFFPRCLWIITADFHQHPGKKQSHLGIIGGLASNSIPYPAIRQLPDTIRVAAPDLIRGLKLNQTRQRITGKLAKQASLGFGSFIFQVYFFPLVLILLFSEYLSQISA